jgi:hypothetical protein
MRLLRFLLSERWIGVATFDNAAHSVAFEQLEAFHQIMTETVLPETCPCG